MPIDDALRVEITDADVRAAKRDWLAARDGGEPAVTVETAFWLYRTLMSTQAQQLADDLRRGRRADHP